MSPSPAIEKFISHWRALKKDGLVPNIQDFLDLPHPELQPFIALLDVISEDVVNIRLMGTGIVQLTGRELTKTNVLEIYTPQLRKKVGRACVSMVTKPCGQMTERLVNTASGLLVPATTATLPVVCKTGQGCLAAYTQTRESVTTGDTMSVVQEILSTEWIDIGAGIPDSVS